ncbi:MAG: septum site-determining protein Ssd [Marmoricola sp.]
MPATEVPVLVITADLGLQDDVRRLAAAAGVAAVVVTSHGAAAAAWSDAHVVLIGGDVVEAVARVGPVRRSDVHVITLGTAPDSLYRAALECGAEVVLTLPSDEAHVIDLLSGAAERAPHRGQVVAVLGGSGGAGATILAAAIASVLARRGPTLVVDGDRRGAGIETFLGLDDPQGARWDALARPVGRLSARALRDSLPTDRGLTALLWSADRSFDVSATAVRDVLRAARRAFETVVIDLPRHPDPISEEVLLRADHVLVVSTLSLPAVLAAARTASRLPTGRTAAVLRGREGPAAVEAQRVLGLPVLAVMRDQRRIDEDVALGVGPLHSTRGPLLRMARIAANAVQADAR